jgi:hypothetical protein
LFRLSASRDPVTPGWTIEVRGRDDANAEVELSSVVTPPYRFWNPRYLDISYGYSAADVVAVDVRQFSFLRDPADYKHSSESLQKAIWPNGIPDQEVARAVAVLDSVPKCSGILRILDHRIVNDPATSRERLDWLKFEVELCPGGNQKGLLELPPTSREFAATHGKTLDSRWAPYLETYAFEYDIILNSVLAPLMPRNVVESPVPWFISSHRRVGENWTYFLSSSVILFDLLKVRCSRGDEATIALYNVSAGEAAGWRLAILRSDYSVARTYDLYAESGSQGPDVRDLIGDMIYTDLAVRENALWARIAYVVTGSGGFPEQGFEYSFQQDGSSCSDLQLRETRLVTGPPAVR